MNLTELINRLEKIRVEIGDATVEVRNAAGDADDAGTIEMVNVSRQKSVVEWRAFIDV